MWDSQKPLDLLMSFPVKLNKEHLENLQATIDVDKIVKSDKNGSELCGIYAPFCDFCDKNVLYPCANAFVKMMQKEGLEVEVPDYVYNSLKVKEPVENNVISADKIEEKVEEKQEADPVKPNVSEFKPIQNKTEIKAKPVDKSVFLKPAVTHSENGARIRIAFVRKKD